jgi:hypothetical protein
LSPWLVRQHQVLGQWRFTSDMGRGLFVGNNPDTFAVYPVGSIDRSQAIALARAKPDAVRVFGAKANPRSPGYDDWLRARALAWVRAHPGQFVINAVRKNLAAFGLLPSPRHGLAENLAHALSYGPVLALALVGVWQERRRWRVHLLFYAQFVLFAAATGLLWGHTSHRTFLDVYLILFAALALAPWLSALRRRVAAAG